MSEHVTTWDFSLVVAQGADRFLLTSEQASESRWHLPTGRVTAGENLLSAARQAGHQWAGTPVEIDGILRVEETPADAGVRTRRVVFTARTAMNSTTTSGVHEGSWFSLDELDRMPMYGADGQDIVEYVARGTAPFAFGA